MYAELIAAFFAVLSVLSVSAAFHIVKRAKKQLTEMSDALEDIAHGNGNRRILSGTRELTAPIAYQINAIVRSYERKLASCRQTEETNRQLMTSLSHDIRTPLTTLIGYLDAVHRGTVTGEEREDYTETARQKAHDLKEYIDVLFDWFKLGSNEYALHMTTVDLTALTREILIDWIPILEDRRILYTARIPELPFFAVLDPDGYARIFHNLIQNMLSHSQADRLEVSLFRQDFQVALRISDNGIGIEKEDLAHIFDRLYKCDKGRSKKGSGLGLSIVRQLAEKMGGSIAADSTPGKGTAFTLLFPLAKSQTQG